MQTLCYCSSRLLDPKHAALIFREIPCCSMECLRRAEGDADRKERQRAELTLRMASTEVTAPASTIIRFPDLQERLQRRATDVAGNRESSRPPDSRLCKNDG